MKSGELEMSHKLSIVMDYYKDWCESARQELVNVGYAISESIPGKKVGDYYLNALKRRIPIKPRKIVQSKEFTIPPTPPNKPDYKKGIDEIKRKAEQGENLNPHLSRNLFEIDYNDALLNDWGIHHLHLGKENNEEFHTGRTKHVLFAVVTDDCFYMINIYDHMWVEKNALDIIYKNWSHLLKPLKGRTAPVLSKKEMSNLRKKNCNVTIELDKGFVIRPPGGGYVASGLSLEVSIDHARIRWQLRQYEKWTEDNIDILIRGIKDRGGIVSSEVEFHIHYEQNCTYIYELKNKNIIRWNIES